MSVDLQQLEACRYYRWHTTHRGTCHGAAGPDCECQCGCWHHQGANAPLETDQIRAQLNAEAVLSQPRSTRTTTHAPRRHRRHTAQLTMLA